MQTIFLSSAVAYKLIQASNSTHNQAKDGLLLPTGAKLVYLERLRQWYIFGYAANGSDVRPYELMEHYSDAT